MSDYDVKFDKTLENHPWSIAFKYIREDTVVLDVGCSKGGLGEALINNKGCTVDGVELDAGDAELAREKLRTVYHGLIEDYLRDAKLEVKYDHIVFMDVIEHLYDPIDVLKMVKVLLKPGGSIVFSIPNMAHISVRLMLLAGKFEYGKTGLLDNTHLHFYTKEEILRVFREAGYEINHLNFTEATYDNKLVKKELQKLGLSASDKGLELLNNKSAKIFQYVGGAMPMNAGKAKRVELKEYSPDPQGTIERDFNQRLDEQKKMVDSLRGYLVNVESERDELLQQLESLKESKALRLAREVERLYRLIRYPRTTGLKVLRRIKNILKN